MDDGLMMQCNQITIMIIMLRCLLLDYDKYKYLKFGLELLSSFENIPYQEISPRY